MSVFGRLFNLFGAASYNKMLLEDQLKSSVLAVVGTICYGVGDDIHLSDNTYRIFTDEFFRRMQGGRAVTNSWYDFAEHVKQAADFSKAIINGRPVLAMDHGEVSNAFNSRENDCGIVSDIANKAEAVQKFLQAIEAIKDPNLLDLDQQQLKIGRFMCSPDAMALNIIRSPNRVAFANSISRGTKNIDVEAIIGKLTQQPTIY